MPGAWEISSKSVLTAFMHPEYTSIAWALGFRNLVLPGPVMPVAGMPYDMARNAMCMAALDQGADYLFMLDTDVVPPRDAVLRLMSHDLPVVSGVYCRRSPPVSVPVMLKGGQWITQFPANQVIDVDLVGAGCLLIRRDVLQKLPAIDSARGKHWFSWRVDMQSLLPVGEALSEDFAFCLHCRRNGIPIKVDTSIQCRHVGFGESTYGRFAPAEATPNT